jgi:hypothetical protein
MWVDLHWLMRAEHKVWTADSWPRDLACLGPAPRLFPGLQERYGELYEAWGS